jgi:hypothetical protein
VEFIESRPFTSKLHRLADETADELLRTIQSELAEKPDRGAMVPGLGAFARHAPQMWAVERANAAVTVTYICTWRRGSTFIF